MWEIWEENRTLHPVGRLLYASQFLLSATHRFIHQTGECGHLCDEVDDPNLPTINRSIRDRLSQVRARHEREIAPLETSFMNESAPLCFASIIHVMDICRPVSVPERGIIQNVVNQFYRLLFRNPTMNISVSPNLTQLETMHDEQIEIVIELDRAMLELQGLLRERGECYRPELGQVERINYGNAIYLNAIETTSTLQTNTTPTPATTNTNFHSTPLPQPSRQELLAH